MKQSGKASFQHILSGVLSVLVAVTLALSLDGYGAVGAAVIGDAETPLADALASAGVDAAGEAAAAEAERAENPGDLGYVPGEIVVVYEEFATKAEKDAVGDLVESAVASEEAVFEGGAAATVAISDELTVETAAGIAQEDPAVKYALPNYVATPMDDPVTGAQGAVAVPDERRGQQWYLDYVEAPAAWELLAQWAAGVAPVKVGVIDTGASLSHPDLARVVDRALSAEVVHDEGATAVSAWRGEPLRGDGYVNGSAAVEEFSSHGTHVCGIIAAEAGNGGVLGVASGGDTAVANGIVDLVAIDAFSAKAQDKRGQWVANGTLQDILFALEYARDAGCSVVNMSLGFDVADQKLVDVFEDVTSGLARSNDVLVVAAAGNSGANAPCVPAVCPSVMGVVSLTQKGHEGAGWGSIAKAAWMSGDVTRSAFSNYGSWCDIAAPGEGIHSTFLSRGTSDSYANMDGTSMACPVVSAVAAMVRAADPTLSAAEVRDLLCRTAVDLCDAGKDDQTGYGAVNARAAVAAALPAAQVPVAGGDAQGAETPQGTSGTEPSQLSGGAGNSDSTGNFGNSGNSGGSGNAGSPGDSGSSGGSGGAPAPGPSPAPGPDVPEVDDPAGSDGDGAADGDGQEGPEEGEDVDASAPSKLQPSAQPGWQSSGGTWRYRQADGSNATGWLRDGSSWYYLDKAGAMVTGWVKVGKSWYYLNRSGAMATGWQKVGKSWYYLKGSGAMATGWYRVGSKWYYSNGSGAMQAGKWIGNYYVTSSGAMAVSTWVGKYHVNASGVWDKTR